MTVRQRVVAVVAALAVVGAGLLVTSSPAHASPDGCHRYSPWATYAVSWNPNVLVTNKFVSSGCGLYTVTDIDLFYVRDSHNNPQCAYFRVELFYADGRSAGAWTVNGKWTWQMICDPVSQPYLQTLLDFVGVGTKYDIQMTPLPGDPLVPLWLGDMAD